jgi:hypothetical protein
MDAGGDAAITDLVRVNGLPVLGVLIPIQRNALAFFSRVLREHGEEYSFAFWAGRLSFSVIPTILKKFW